MTDGEAKRGSAVASAEPWHRLHGKVVMVTGASSGLGREFCLDLAKAGCRVVAAARRTDRLESLCDEIQRLSSSPASTDAAISEAKCIAVELDVTASAALVAESVRKAWDAFGRIDVLVNNAGVRGKQIDKCEVLPSGCWKEPLSSMSCCLQAGNLIACTIHSPLSLSEDEWITTMKTNLTGSWLVAKYVCELMRDAKQKGSIINISSITGLDRGQTPGALAYAVSKTGVNAMTKVMAVELGVHNIRVNSISPGIFKSEITKGLMQKPWLSKVAHKTTPLRTYGTADPALTSLVRFLIHDSSEYVSGNLFVADAGATLPGVPIFSSL
ncbi:hypothetical protein ACLOJK_008255 [Asimina triloba]